MAEEPEGQTINMLSAKEPDSRTVTKNFQGHTHSLAHENRLQVQKTENSWGQLEIRNHIATINGQKVVKLTEIQFQDRIVKIIDSFTCASSPPHLYPQLPSTLPQEHTQQNNSLSKEIEKPQQVSSTSDGQDCQEEGKIRDTKNIVRGVFKMFEAWSRDHAPPEFQVDTTLKYFVNSHGKYNHKLVVKLSKEPILRKAFIAFCDAECEYLICGSKSQDKHGLIPALKRYHNLCLGEQAFSYVYCEQEESSQEKKTSKKSEKLEFFK